MDQKTCSECKLPIFESYIFCPNCGINLKNAGVPMLFKQLGIYLLSILLPPLGLFPGISYAKRKNPIARRIGIVAIALTILATIITLWMFFGFMQTVITTLNQQINLQDIGY